MERIVLGISAISFNNSDTLTEKPIFWTNKNRSESGMARLERMESPATAESSDLTDSETTPPSRRTLPGRMAKSKENSILRIKRRSIMKPRRNLNIDIKKLYLDNKIKSNFRPSKLETIFEENDNNFIGAKKIKRSLSCSDGLNTTKTTVKSRRLKIKKTFGRRFALKKISLDDFIDRLNASFEDKSTTSKEDNSNLEESNSTSKIVCENEMECADDGQLLT